MTRAVRRRILLVGPDVDFRQEVFNFLLSEGCDVAISSGEAHDVLEKIRSRHSDVVILDADSIGPDAERLAREAAALFPRLRVIVAITAEPRDASREPRQSSASIQFLIKDTWMQDLPYALQG